MTRLTVLMAVITFVLGVCFSLLLTTLMSKEVQQQMRLLVSGDSLEIRIEEDLSAGIVVSVVKIREQGGGYKINDQPEIFANKKTAIAAGCSFVLLFFYSFCSSATRSN